MADERRDDGAKTEPDWARAAEKRARFFAAHRADRPFVLANAWDSGSAQLLSALGAEAIGTSSAGFAFTLGRADARTTRAEAVAHAQELDGRVAAPVSADLEAGYGWEPEAAADTVQAALAAGLAGCSIEDTDFSDPRRPASLDFELSVARIAAAVGEARKSEAAGRGPFVLTARADGVMLGAYDVSEAIRRLKAFEAAGAHVIYAPALPDMDALVRVRRETTAALNVLAAGRFAEPTLRDYATLGVRRISLGGALARVTHAAAISAASALLSDGDFSRLQGAAAGEEVDALLAAGRDAAARGEAPEER